MLCADSLSSMLFSSVSLGGLGLRKSWQESDTGLSHGHTDHSMRQRGATGSQHSPVPLWTESFPAPWVLGAFCHELKQSLRTAVFSMTWPGGSHVDPDLSSLFEEGAVSGHRTQSRFCEQ